MPRSYSFDHFQVPKTLPKQQASLREEDKQHLSEVNSVGDTGIHYGKSHAETEHILQARRMARQLEELAAPTLEAEEKFSRSAASTKPRAKKKAQPAAQSAVASAAATAPIGALPQTEEAPAAAAPASLSGVLDEGQRQLRALQGALGDARSAARRLAALPMEAVRTAARLAAQRLHLVHG
jgi:hypothetical protein